MPGIMSEGANFENHQTTARQPPHRLWHRHRLRLASDKDSLLSRRIGLAWPIVCGPS